MRYKLTSDTQWTTGHPLYEISQQNGKYVGSIFFTTSGVSYDVEVDVGQTTLSDSITTQNENDLELPVPSKSYHVSPDGTGSECSASNPCGFSSALNQVKAGEEILLGGGVYYTGEHNFPSGSAGQRIVLRNKEGEQGIVN